MAVYNTSFMDTSTNILQLLIGIGGALNYEYLLGNMILFSFFLVSLILATKWDFLEVLILNSFLTCILAILFAYAGLVMFSIIVIPAIIFFVAIVFLFFTRG